MNNAKAPPVPRMEPRDTAVSSALCGVLRYNQPVPLPADFDHDDDPYKNTTPFRYVFSEKPPRIHRPHDEEAKPHRKAGHKVLYRIDMVENGQPNLLFVDVKGGYVEPAAVDTQGRDMREVVLEVAKAFYSRERETEMGRC